jgi:hypothetical protein
MDEATHCVFLDERPHPLKRSVCSCTCTWRRQPTELQHSRSIAGAATSRNRIRSPSYYVSLRQARPRATSENGVRSLSYLRPACHRHSAHFPIMFAYDRRVLDVLSRTSDIIEWVKTMLPAVNQGVSDLILRRGPHHTCHWDSNEYSLYHPSFPRYSAALSARTNHRSVDSRYQTPRTYTN